MSYRTVISLAAAAILGVACISTDAWAYRGGGARGGGRVGGYHGGGRVGGYHGGARVGGYGRPGWGVGAGVGAAAVGAAAVGAAVAAPYYYNSVRCGYAPFPPCY
jgi:hypothetical protein